MIAQSKIHDHGFLSDNYYIQYLINCMVNVHDSYRNGTIYTQPSCFNKTFTINGNDSVDIIMNYIIASDTK